MHGFRALILPLALLASCPATAQKSPVDDAAATPTEREAAKDEDAIVVRGKRART